MTQIPLSILKKIKSLMFRLLWSSSTEGGHYHLVNWEGISLPKEMGGWNIKNVFWFSTALCMKSIWNGIFGGGLWTDVLHDKYIKNYIIEWIKKPPIKCWNASLFWRSFMKTFPWINCQLAW